MNELLLRAPCFGGRGFESSQDLTLPERLWWTRASVAKTSKNVQEALKLVQESRDGRYIRGYVLDSELALLDDDVSRMMGVHFGFDAAAFSSANCKLVPDNTEREKVKSQILMERLLLRSCEGVKSSFKVVLQSSSTEQQIGTHGHSTKKPLTTETSLETKDTQNGSDFREEDNIGDSVLQFSMEPKMSTSNLPIGSTDSVLSKISVNTHIAPKQKRGFGKRVRSFFAKLGRCIGSGMCCGRRAED